MFRNSRKLKISTTMGSKAIFCMEFQCHFTSYIVWRPVYECDFVVNPTHTHTQRHTVFRHSHQWPYHVRHKFVKKLEWAAKAKKKESHEWTATTMANQLVSLWMSFTFSRSLAAALSPPTQRVPIGLRHFSCRVINIIIVIVTTTHIQQLELVLAADAGAAAKRQ